MDVDMASALRTIIKTRKNIMLKKSIGVVHVVAECEDCGKEFQNHINGQALAAKHAKHYKHKVRGEIGLVFVYDGRD